jgi:flagellar protein FliO/FliZ
MLQTALPAVGLLVAMLVVAWLLQRWRRHLPGVSRHAGPALKVMNSLSLGPQQRVVTVQVGEGAERLCLVLGVAPGGITALHQMPLPPELLASAAPSGESEGFKARLNQFIHPHQSEAPHAAR